MWTIYKHINKINGKIYIGITKQNPEKRWGPNGNGYLKKRNNKYKNPYFGPAILKYGWDNFEHIIIRSDLTKEQAEFAERQLIIFYQTTNRSHGYNVATGGSVRNQSEETKKKISEFQKGRIHSEESIKKMAEAQKGKYISEESKKKMSESHLGKSKGPMSEDHKRKIGESNKGKRMSEESKKKISETKKGKPSKRKGTHLSEETKRKISETKKNRKKENI